MSEVITVEPATVYKACGRRFFTKKAAAYHLVREIFKERCKCEPFEPETGWHYGCKYHKDSSRLEELKRRLTKRLMRTRFSPNGK